MGDDLTKLTGTQGEVVDLIKKEVGKVKLVKFDGVDIWHVVAVIGIVLNSLGIHISVDPSSPAGKVLSHQSVQIPAEVEK